MFKESKLSGENSQLDSFGGFKQPNSIAAQRTLYSSKGFSGQVKDSSSSLKGASPRGAYAVGTGNNYDMRDSSMEISLQYSGRREEGIGRAEIGGRKRANGVKLVPLNLQRGVR